MDHKDVALSRESSRILTHPKKVLLMPQIPSHLAILQLSFTRLPSCFQHRRGRTNLISGLVQQLPQKFHLTSLFALGEDVRTHRRSFNPLEARSVARTALFDHAESKTFVLRRFARSGCTNEKSIYPARAVSHSRTRFPLVGDNSHTQQGHTRLRTFHRTTLKTCLCVPDQWRRLHTRHQENFSRLGASYASSMPARKQSRPHPFKMLGCVAMIICPLVDDPSVRFAQAASGAVSQIKTGLN